VFIEGRRQNLQAFLQSLCSSFPHSPAVRAFLTSDATSMSRDSVIDLAALPLPPVREQR
jgi:hypothetical protein